MIIRSLFVPLTAAAVIALAGHAVAQGAFPAPLPSGAAAPAQSNSPFPPVNGGVIKNDPAFPPVNASTRSDPAFPPVNGGAPQASFGNPGAFPSNGAAPIGAPAAGRFTKPGFENGDYHYVHGTPVMATMYGLDILAPMRWGKAPDLVLSGPNEGQNVGRIVNSSGTIGNVQFAAARGIPSVALSAGSNTVDNTNLAAPNSSIVAGLSVKLIKELQARHRRREPLLPDGMALNVNFPDAVTRDTAFAFSRIGTFDLYNLKFVTSPSLGLGFTRNDPRTATRWQAEDESVVVGSKVAVTAMQVSFDQGLTGQLWLKQHFRKLFD